MNFFLLDVDVTITSSLHVPVNESAGFVKVCVDANRQSQITYEVILSTEEGTATGNFVYWEWPYCDIFMHLVCN